MGSGAVDCLWRLLAEQDTRSDENEDTRNNGSNDGADEEDDVSDEHGVPYLLGRGLFPSMVLVYMVLWDNASSKPGFL